LLRAKHRLQASPSPETAPETLYLVNPAGGRYAIATFPSTPDQPGELEDWSGDGSHALFAAGGAGSPTTIITEVDLHTGARTTFTVNDSSVAPRYTRPDGKAVLLTVQNHGLARVDLAGKPQLTYPTDKLAGTFHGQYLSTTGRHAAGAGYRLRPCADGQRRNSRKGAAGCRRNQLLTGAVVGRRRENRPCQLQRRQSAATAVAGPHRRHATDRR